MNKNIFYLTALLFVFGCSNQSSEPEVMEAEVETVLLAVSYTHLRAHET